MSCSELQQLVCEDTVEENENNEVPEAVSMVLNLEELRDMILARAGKRNWIYLDSFIRLRLVSKDWLSSVSKVCYKNGLPVIQLNLREVDENVDDEVQNANTLEHFVSQFSSAYSSNDKNAPTYSLNVGAQFFEDESFSILQNSFVQCGKGLVELEMELDKESDIPNTLSKFTFPNLKTLKINTFSIRYFNQNQLEMDKSSINNTANLFKHILEGSSSLEQLHFYNSVPLYIFGFDNILLPPTLTSLWTYTYSLLDLKILAKTILPKLSYLNLKIRKVRVSDYALYNVLSNCSKSLTNLCLYFQDEPAKMRFPVMQKLDSLTLVCSFNIYLKLVQQNNELEVSLPNLKFLKLSLTESAFQQWCVKSVYHSVETLRVKLSSHEPKYIPLNLQSIQLTSMAFPNVKRLYISIMGNEASGVQHIFKEMIQLTHLTLCVHGTELIRGSNFWDALLIGATTETVEKIKCSLDDQENAAILEHTNMPSIRQLSNLRMLDFSTGISHDSVDAEQLISEVSFVNAFFRMPNLANLFLDGRFRIPDEMRESLRQKMRHSLRICT